MRAIPQHRSKGQELLEFALTLPILVLLLFGILDLGRAVYYYSALQNAVREGARFGIVDPNRTALIDGVVRSQAVALDPAELNQVVISNNATDHTLTVRYQYRFNPAIPLIGTIIEWVYGPGIDYILLTASSTMGHEY